MPLPQRSALTEAADARFCPAHSTRSPLTGIGRRRVGHASAGHGSARRGQRAGCRHALPNELRRSLACTNVIENIVGSIRRLCRAVECWRDALMALRWTAAAMLEAAKGFRRLKANSHLPLLRSLRAPVTFDWIKPQRHSLQYRRDE